MVKSCCVKSCRAEWSPVSPLSFFSVPMKNEELLNKWKEAIPNSKLGKYSSICSKHFLPNRIQRIGAKPKLIKNAVPTVFADKQLQPTALIDHTYLRTIDSAYPVVDLSQNVNDSPELCAFLEIPQNTTVESLQSNAHNQRLVDVPNKKDVSVQTSPHRVGPSEREVQLQRKIRILQAKLRRREKSIASTKKLVEHLKHSGKSSDNSEDVLLKNLNGMDLELFQNHVSNNNIEKNHRSYTTKMKEFASTLYFYSPQAYCFIRKSLNLPHPATLRKWIGPETTKKMSTREAQVAEADQSDGEVLTETARSVKGRKPAVKRQRGKKAASIIYYEAKKDELEDGDSEEFLEPINSILEEAQPIERKKRKTAAKKSRGRKVTPLLEEENNIEIDADEDPTEIEMMEAELAEYVAEDTEELEALEVQLDVDGAEDAGVFEALEVEFDQEGAEECVENERTRSSAEGDTEDNNETDSQSASL